MLLTSSKNADFIKTRIHQSHLMALWDWKYESFEHLPKLSNEDVKPTALNYNI